MRTVVLSLAILLTSTLGMLLTGCFVTNQPDTTSEEEPKPLPVVNEFAAIPDSISPGNTATLSWSVSNASTVSIDKGIGNVALNGNRSVSPDSTTVYTLTAIGEGGSNTATAQVMVNSSMALPPASPPDDTPTLSVVPVINSFTANPAAITTGNPTILSWSISNASSVTIIPDIGAVANTGDREVSPTETTEYLITATNGGNISTRSVIVEVSDVSGVAHVEWLGSSNVVYDFIEQAPSAVWRSGRLTGTFLVKTISFPGATNDSDGFACYRLNTKLTDGITYARLLETHPCWIDDGFIGGMYSDIFIPAGAKLKLKVGIINGATSGKVRFKVHIADIGYTAWSQPVAYADGVKTAEIDLSDFAGQTRTFELYVDTDGVSTQDWAAWAEAKIVN